MKIMVPLFHNCSMCNANTERSHADTGQEIARGDIQTSGLFQYNLF
jgi:hypothetical protein